MSDQPIIVFDSGIGGLSILKYLQEYDVSLLYYADQANFPYGDKSESWVNQRLGELAQVFANYNPRAVVVACNTGTVAGIEFMRSKLTCPVFGVEPVVKMLANHQNPVVWGTKITISSAKAATLKKAHGNHVRFYTPVGLAAAIEYDDDNKLNKVLAITKTHLNEPDAIGLSCTHYPLVINQIIKLFPGAKIYDPSTAVVSHIQKTLNLSFKKGYKADITYLSSGDVLRLKKMATKYL